MMDPIKGTPHIQPMVEKDMCVSVHFFFLAAKVIKLEMHLLGVV